MAPIAMTTELKVLAWSVILLLVQIALQGSAASLEFGLGYNAGPRDEPRVLQSPLAGRAQRALANLLETYGLFIALALALAVTGRSGGAGAIGALVWFWARVAYVVVYLAGIAYLRTAIWIVSIVGLLMMLARLMA